MHCKVKTKPFLTMLKIANIFNRDIKFSMIGTELFAEGVDSANACLLRMAIPAEGDECEFCTDYDKFYSILNTSKDDDTEIEISDVITIKTGNTKFKLAKYNIGSSRAIPKMEWRFHATMAFADFASAMASIANIATIMQIEYKSGQFVMTGLDGINRVDCVIPIEDADGPDVIVSVSMDYIKDTILNFRGADKLRIGLTTDAPMTAHLKTDEMEMQIILAPRIRD